MRTNVKPAEGVYLAALERKHLEADWRRAWESCADAAQAGDYAEAERWHRQATSLGKRLVAYDLALGEVSQAFA